MGASSAWQEAFLSANTLTQSSSFPSLMFAAGGTVRACAVSLAAGLCR